MPLREFSRDKTWLLPPTLEELLPADHPARYVGLFVDALDRAEWGKLGIAPDGAARGALAYHPRVLLGVWLYGFMTGVRSSRKLEGACRDPVPYLWLTGWQRPDHTTVWRFYQGHRQTMRTLLKRTVRTAVEAGLVDLAVQAVDGTRVAGSAARERTLDPAGLEGLLECVEIALDDLEAQNAGGDDPPPGRLPRELTQLEALRARVQAAIGRVAATDGPARANVTDPDATLQKARGGGFLVGYNAQAMVAGLVPQHPDDPDEPGGLLIVAADVTTDRDDHGQLLPLLEQAAATTETPVAQVLADGGYHSAANLAACAAQDPPVPVLMPDPHAPRPSQPYHKDRFVYDPDTDTFNCPQGQTLTFQGCDSRQAGGPPIRRYRASTTACAACPVRAACTTSTTRGRSITISPDDRLLRAHRAAMASDAAKTAYRRRKTLPEPTFGILKEQQTARRFLLRGLANVQAEWSLLAVAFNLRTLARRWRATVQPAPATRLRSVRLAAA
jgi:transposase